MPMLTGVQSADCQSYPLQHQGREFSWCPTARLVIWSQFKTEAQANEGKARISDQQERAMPFCGMCCKAVQPEPNYL
jgi:hypothetical protein